MESHFSGINETKINYDTVAIIPIINGNYILPYADDFLRFSETLANTPIENVTTRDQLLGMNETKTPFLFPQKQDCRNQWYGHSSSEDLMIPQVLITSGEHKTFISSLKNDVKLLLRKMFDLDRTDIKVVDYLKAQSFVYENQLLHILRVVIDDPDYHIRNEYCSLSYDGILDAVNNDRIVDVISLAAVQSLHSVAAMNN